MKYVNITSPDINNGTGFRVTLWVAGCSHHCRGCHNQATWDYNIGKELSLAYDEVDEKLGLSQIKGLTVSGGDPLAQDKKSLFDLYDFLKKVKQDHPNKDIWLYTGYSMDEINEDEDKWRILDFCDYVVDGEFKLSLRDTSLPFRGSSNQKIWHKVDNEFATVEM